MVHWQPNLHNTFVNLRRMRFRAVRHCHLFEVLSVELMRRGKIDSVVGLRNFEGALPEPSGLIQPVEKVIPAALPVKTHRIVKQPELHRHLFTIIHMSHVIHQCYTVQCVAVVCARLRRAALGSVELPRSNGVPRCCGV